MYSIIMVESSKSYITLSLTTCTVTLSLSWPTVFMPFNGPINSQTVPCLHMLLNIYIYNEYIISIYIYQHIYICISVYIYSAAYVDKAPTTYIYNTHILYRYITY